MPVGNLPATATLILNSSSFTAPLSIKVLAVGNCDFEYEDSNDSNGSNNPFCLFISPSDLSTLNLSILISLLLSSANTNASFKVSSIVSEYRLVLKAIVIPITKINLFILVLQNR